MSRRYTRLKLGSSGVYAGWDVYNGQYIDNTKLVSYIFFHAGATNSGLCLHNIRECTDDTPSSRKNFAVMVRVPLTSGLDSIVFPPHAPSLASDKN